MGCDIRVFRGGSWHSILRDCRSANRNGYYPSVHIYRSGLRAVCVPRIPPVAANWPASAGTVFTRLVIPRFLRSGAHLFRVLCGGSWIYKPGFCRSAYRLGYFPTRHDIIICFRTVCAPRTPQKKSKKGEKVNVEQDE